jgi:hypothetical protein
MRFSVRDLLLYSAFACLMLALTRLPFLAGCAILIIGITAAKFLIPIRTWRFVVYGALVGIVAASVALTCYLELEIQGPHTYTDGRPEIADRLRPYVVHLGALVGGSVGLAICKARSGIAV